MAGRSARRWSTSDDALLAQSRALGDPTRCAIFVELRDAPASRTVAELTDRFGLNHNAIRQHLVTLVEAGLVVGEPGPVVGPGRPPVRYRTVPGVSERFGGSGPHEALSQLLVELVVGGDAPLEVGRRAGRRLAEEQANPGDAVDVLLAVARRLGFEPRVEVGPGRPGGVDVVLDRCPFVGPASAAADVVCVLHQGIAEGIAAAAEGDAEVVGLVVRPPRRAGCRIQVDPHGS
ncbi:MAG: helix-turn-helix domain-containing protein [Actinobacteria bacterium]|nr:helix-turn-helix domain-containing protein [Actinomycetota bacterium]